MKKILCIALLLSLAPVAAYAQSRSTVDGKVGTVYATDPEAFGLNVGFTWMKELDPFFALGLDPSIFWIRWRDKLDKITTESGVAGSKVRDTDAFMMPVLANAQVRLVPLEAKLKGFLPYFNLGLGYSPMILSYQNADGDARTDYFGGFTSRFSVGMAYTPGSNSRIRFIVEAGYQYAPLKNFDDVEIDMSGPFASIGVRYPL